MAGPWSTASGYVVVEPPRPIRPNRPCTVDFIGPGGAPFGLGFDGRAGFGPSDTDCAGGWEVRLYATLSMVAPLPRLAGLAAPSPRPPIPPALVAHGTGAVVGEGDEMPAADGSSTLNLAE